MRKFDKIYTLTICIFAIVSVGLAIKDFSAGLSKAEVIMDAVIYYAFVIDYIARFGLSQNKKDFFRSNVPDLIAIVPFNSAFRAFRLLKFSKAFRLLKLFKISALSARVIGKSKRFFDTNGFKYVLLLTLIGIAISSVGMIYFEKMELKDAIWWSFVTATTVGYGDLSPATDAGRIIASILMLIGIGLIGSLTSTITNFFLSAKTTSSSDKVNMTILLYENLTKHEKEEFHKIINNQ